MLSSLVACYPLPHEISFRVFTSRGRDHFRRLRSSHDYPKRANAFSFQRGALGHDGYTSG